MEKEKIEKLISMAKTIGEKLKSFPGHIRIVSHHDADGIASAAIFVKALFREGKDFHLTLVKQLTEDFIVELGKEKNKLIVFLDLGSGQLESIQKHLTGIVIVADHHQIQGKGQGLYHINPLEFGITENVSGSGVSYLLARAINPENMDLSELAIVGAIGDAQTSSIGPDWGLSGLNKEILLDAQNSGKVAVRRGLRLWGRSTRPIHKALERCLDPYIPGVSGSESGAVHFLQELGIKIKNENGEWRTLDDMTENEQRRLATGIIKERIRGKEENPEWIFGDVYELVDKPALPDAAEFATALNAAGKMKKGYLGVALCLNDPDSLEEMKETLNTYRRGIARAIDWIRQNKHEIKTTANANYILAGGNISEYIISNVTSIFSRSFLPDKPIFAFVDTEDGDVKISSRAENQGVDVGSLTVQAAKTAGGDGGGHTRAAGARIPKGKEEMFINCVEEILAKEPFEREHKIDMYGKGKEEREKMEGKGLVYGSGTQTF